MTKIKLQTISQLEIDTDTGRQRLLKSWTKLLGEGNGSKNPKKPPKKIDDLVIIEEDEEWY